MPAKQKTFTKLQMLALDSLAGTREHRNKENMVLISVEAAVVVGLSSSWRGS